MATDHSRRSGRFAIGKEALTVRSIGRIVQTRASAVGFVVREFGGSASNAVH
jgi:hypothetical protein